MWAASAASGWLVAAGGVEFEVADEVIGDEYRCVLFVDDDGGVVVCPLDADVDDVVADSQSAGFVHGDVFRWAAGGRVRQGCWCWARWGAGVESFDRDASTDALMRPVKVVDLAELVELGLEFGDVAGEGLFAEPLLQGLLEPFDFAGRLRVVGPSSEGLDAGIAESGFEQHFEPA